MAALGLTACGGDAEGEPGSSASPATSAVASEAATPTPTPSATPEYKPASADGPAENVPLPDMPSEAKLKSQQGLEAFIPYWFETLSYAYETGDLAPLQKSTGPDCLICGEFTKSVVEGNANNRWIVGGRLDVVEIEDRFIETIDGDYAPIVFLTQQPLDYYESGELLGTAKGFSEPLLWVATIEYADGQWKMLDFERPKDAS
ncbi:DUF6318 family protein [Arthrobacter crystallopoietes]|uniref:DUF6318 family protein n=1 Tax=Crystallibacter crystallopoietes TaxID=37928 RepID=UPI001ABDED12|nr:DUF6318 family protein [Arthrobacter crystallopoietes]QTG82802.1 hypothetical protein J5251_09945 [Arthrobacter crystallopoietes]